MSYGSAEANFIYIRIPRTGSSSFVHHLEKDYADLQLLGRPHTTAPEAQLLWGAEWDSRLTFGVIRNPWEWMVSIYNSGVSVTGNVTIKEPWAGPLMSDAEQGHPGQRMNHTFAEWVLKRQTTPVDWLSDDDGIIVDEIHRFEDIAPTLDVKISDMAHEHYSIWYDEQTAAHVEKLCKREIEIGGYKYEIS